MNAYTYHEGSRAWTVYTVDPLPQWVTLAQVKRLAHAPGRCQWYWVTASGGAGGAFSESNARNAANQHRDRRNSDDTSDVCIGRLDQRSFRLSCAIAHWNERASLADSDRQVLSESALIYWSDGQRIWRPTWLGINEGLIAGTSLAGGVVT